MSFLEPSIFINTLTTDERLNGKEYNLKRKNDWLDNEEDDDYQISGEENLHNILNIDNYNPHKYIKKDIILSNYNINYYDNPLLNGYQEQFDRFERRINLLHKNNYIHFSNYQKLNDNIKLLFRNNISQFNDLNTKIDILNTKLNHSYSKIQNNDVEFIDTTHKLCLKKDRLEKGIKEIKLKK